MRIDTHKNYIIEQWEDEDDLDAQLGEYKDSILNHDLVSAVSRSRHNANDQEWDQNGVDKELEKYLQKKLWYQFWINQNNKMAI